MQALAPIEINSIQQLLPCATIESSVLQHQTASIQQIQGPITIRKKREEKKSNCGIYFFYFIFFMLFVGISFMRILNVLTSDQGPTTSGTDPSINHQVQG